MEIEKMKFDFIEAKRNACGFPSITIDVHPVLFGKKKRKIFIKDTENTYWWTELGKGGESLLPELNTAFNHHHKEGSCTEIMQDLYDRGVWHPST
jgi:hypothetical protein